MSPRDAISESSRAYQTEGTRWPFPLLAYIDQPPDDRRVFGWLCSCVGDLLDHLGKTTDELMDALSFARQSFEHGNLEAIEARAWSLWLRRSVEGASFAAVAQLLFAISRANRADRPQLAGACSTPICLLEGLETRRGEVFERVIGHFFVYVDNDPAI